MIPANQIRAVDPHSSYNSDNVNRLMRVVTKGLDAIARDTDLLPSKDSNTSIRITEGICVKDDVMIQIVGDSYLDISDPNDFVEGSIFSGSFPVYGYLVLVYQYIKQPIPVVAELKILKTIANFDPNLFLFLGRVYMDSALVIDTVEISDPGVRYRQVLNLSDPYTDDRARAADAYNPITNHANSGDDDANKMLGTDSSGCIVYIPMSELGYNEIYYDVTDPAWRTSGNFWTITVEHNVGKRPWIDIIEASTGEVFSPANIIHNSVDELTVYIDKIVYPSKFAVYIVF